MQRMTTYYLFTSIEIINVVYFVYYLYVVCEEFVHTPFAKIPAYPCNVVVSGLIVKFCNEEMMNVALDNCNTTFVVIISSIIV